jgi:hypothetical protein
VESVYEEAQEVEEDNIDGYLRNQGANANLSTVVSALGCRCGMVMAVLCDGHTPNFLLFVSCRALLRLLDVRPTYGALVLALDVSRPTTGAPR